MTADPTRPLGPLWSDRFGLAPDLDPATPVAEGVARVLARRSQRRYRDEPVPDALLRVLLACAQSAPSKSDLQQMSIINVVDPAKRAAIAGWMPSQPWVGKAPVFLVFCADMRRGQRIAAQRGHGHDNDNLDTFLNASVDAALALGAFMLAAEQAGLGCCPISLIRDHIEKASELLRIPPGVFPIAGLCVGWPSQEGHASMRLPPAAVIHTDVYDDGGLEALVDDYDRRRDARHAIAPDQQRHTDRYGVAAFCGWSENAARQLSVAERARFRAFLEGHGFALR